MVAMVFRRMASSTPPSKLGALPLVHFPSSPLDPAGALPALGTPPESTGGGDMVLTTAIRFLYNDDEPTIGECKNNSKMFGPPGPIQISAD